MKNVILIAGAALAFASGCCHKQLEMRLLLGHKTIDECAKLVVGNQDAPVSIVCPGDEVTLCWGTNNGSVDISMDHDPGGVAGHYSGSSGVQYFKPTETSSVTVTADCVSRKRKMTVVNGPTPATFDGRWSGDCAEVSYEADPLFFSPSLLALDVQAQWVPMQSGMPVKCAAAPFLTAYHDTPGPYQFFIEKEGDPPYVFRDGFGNPDPRQLDGSWQYDPKACVGKGFKCEQNEHAPFQMTLVCQPPK
jgi:hypothetical protein